MRGASNSHFAVVPSAEIQRSRFNRSHGLKTTFDAGFLVPVFVDEVLPGDTFNLRMSAFCRLATPIKPIMDNIYLDSHFFFVPNRLVWDNFEKFMGQQANPGDSTDYLLPFLVANTNIGLGSVGDYFGLPTGIALSSATPINSLPFRAYNLIWNEWFRDQNLQTSRPVPRNDGPDVYATNNWDVLARRGKRHDYFTSALPFAQKGTAVTLPLGSTAPITRVTNANAINFRVAGSDVFATPGTASFVGGAANLQSSGAAGTFLSMDPNGSLVADLSSATAATINSLRQAFQLQRLYERDARGGTRYIETVFAHFGVTSPDARLQRPEYLGGGSTMINVNPIAQTSSQTGQPTPQGNLAAMGTASIRGHGFSRSFVEHGYVVGMVSARADMTYQRCVNRMWTRRTRFDFYWPVLAHLGEQTVLNREIYYQGNNNDALVWGYQERYAEYRYKPSQVTNLFRSSAAGTLDFWHLAQSYVSLPTLGNTFIQEDPPIDRIIAVTTEPHFLGDFYFDLNCVRPMPVYSVPGLIDHF